MSTNFFAKKFREYCRIEGAKNTWLRDPSGYYYSQYCNAKVTLSISASWGRIEGVEIYLHSFFLNLGTRWMWVVSFMPRSPYSSGRTMFWREYKYLADSNLHHAIRSNSVYLSKEISETAFSQPAVDAAWCLGSHGDGVTPGVFWNMTSCRYDIAHGYQYSGRIFCISVWSKMKMNFSRMKEIKSRNM